MKTMFLIAAILFALFALSMGRMSARAMPRPADEPPLENFTKTVSPTTAVAGDVVRYAIQFINPVEVAYTATVAISDTLDPHLEVIAASRTAQRGDGATVGRFIDPPAGSQAVSWSAEVFPGDAITITFDVTVTRGVTAAKVLTNVAHLYVIDAGSAMLTATALLLQQPFTLHLPIVVRRLEAFPAVINGSFELTPSTGWLVNPSYLIVPYTDIKEDDPTFTPPGGNLANLYLAWIGGESDKTHTLSQSVTLPRGYTSAGLRYKYWISSQERDCTQDTATLTISTRAPTSPLVYPIQLCEAQNTALPGQVDGWRETLIDLTDLIAQTADPRAETPLTITFQGNFNPSLISNLWIEDVALCSDQAGVRGAPPCTNAAGGR